MTMLNSRFASLAALVAATSMVATPLAAAELPVSAARASVPVAAWDADAQNAHQYGYGGWGYRRHRDRVDAGDVLAGVLIIGGIAAIASAASKSKQRETYREPYPRPYNSRYNSDQGINRAVDACMGAIERDVRVDSVDSVARNANGWQVSGRLYNGDGFTCSVGSNGAIDRIDYGGRSLSQQDNQWSDERYAQARRDADAAGGDAVGDVGNGPSSSYPGGPVDGDDYPGGDYPQQGG
ncbi:MAG: hypothetical protein IE921_09675 [Rhodobacteraceae bacterium]|nr:hypothetical protein [Paracoccaceae bacterium]